MSCISKTHTGGRTLSYDCFADDRRNVELCSLSFVLNKVPMRRRHLSNDRCKSLWSCGIAQKESKQKGGSVA